MSMGFVGCDNYELPNPPAQSNPATAPFDTDNIVITPLEDEANTVLDLKALNDADQMAPLADIQLSNWPAEYELMLTMYMSLNPEMFPLTTVPVKVVDGVVCVEPDVLEGAFKRLTKNPAEATVYVNYSAMAALTEGSKLYIGGPDYHFGSHTIKVLPFAADAVIEDSYYLLHNGTKTALNHSSENPYDDPVFNVVVEITEDEAAAGYEWQLVPASGNPVMGGAGLTGDLQEGLTGKVSLSGPVMFTFDLEARTYEILNAYTVLYTPGASNGWSQAESQTLYTSDYQKYSGWINVVDQFKFCATLDWAVNWGVGAAEGTLAPDGENIAPGADGVYYASVNLTELTYALTRIETCGVIGAATEYGWDAQTNLTQSADNPLVWEGKVKFGDGLWKIRFNDNWDYNLGGDMANLTEGGSDIPSPGVGEYTVKVDLSQSPYIVTVQ